MTTLLWTIDEILRFHCPTQSTWSPDGSTIAFLWQAAGEEELRLVPTDSPGMTRTLPPLPPQPGSKMWGSVQSGYVWCPDSKGLLRVSDGIWLCDLPTGEQKKLTTGEQPESCPSWSPDGRHFAYRQANQVAFYDMATFSTVAFPVPGVVYAFAPQLAWSPDETRVAVAFRRTDAAGRPGRRGLDVAVLSIDGQIHWATDTPGTVANPQWVDDERLLITRHDEAFTTAEHVLVHVPTGEERQLFVEREPKGLLQGDVEGVDVYKPILSPDHKEAILVHPVERWKHLHLLDLQTGALRQLTYGECEDSGPVWSPDGRYVAYLSNGHPSLASLDVWVLEKETGQSRPLASMPGAKAELTWSPDGHNLSFLHAGPGEPPGLWVGQVADLSYKRLILDRSPGDVWVHNVPPQQVWIEASDGYRTPGLLYTRPEIRNQPAIIWLHGGLGMQYYLGWPTDYGSCIQHAFFQLLAQAGYTVLYLNYRGSTGYGMEHEQGNYNKIGVAEVADIAGSARFLASLPQVAADRLCVAGRSYGGFAALAALTRLPDLFRLGIVIAGTGDISGSLELGSDFWDDIAYYRWRLGWSHQQHPDAWQAATVLHELDKLQAPLVIFHGIDDQAVSVEEAYKVERRCRELGKPCFAHYYAGEDHVFSLAETWRDVFENIRSLMSNLNG